MIIRKFYQIDAKALMIGTTNGTKKDTQMFVESQIEKYFDIPKKCSYRIVKVDKENYNFEIQESSITGSVIEELLLILEDEPKAKLMISTPEDVQYQVYRRDDGTLRTLIHSDDEQIKHSDEDSVVVLEGKTSKLTPFFSSLTVAMWSCVAMFAFSIASASIAASISVSVSEAESGYKDAIADNPVAFATQNGLIDQYSTTKNLLLPSMAGVMSIERYQRQSNKPIGKLEFRKGSWITIPYSPEVKIKEKQQQEEKETY